MSDLRYVNGDVYFVTDTAGDVIEGNRAEVKTIAVTWGFHDRERLEKAKPDIIVNTPEELLNYFSLNV